MKDKAHYGESAEKRGVVRPEEDWLGCRTPSPEDWENIFNSMTDMVTVHDADFNIICANEAAKRILRLPTQAGLTLKCFHYYHGTECPPRGCPSCRTYKTGEPAEFETFEPRLNMYVEIRAIPRFDENRSVIGLIHIVRDITQRKENERELERHRYRLEELVEARTAALTLANQELQNALSKISTLKGLIPICAWCKKVRDDQGYWNLLETYIKSHSDADFTHGICPECLVRLKRQDDTK